jgi:hypothetical protein
MLPYFIGRGNVTSTSEIREIVLLLPIWLWLTVDTKFRKNSTSSYHAVISGRSVRQLDTRTGLKTVPLFAALRAPYTLKGPIHSQLNCAI